jgi:hypothetical protein
MGIMREEIQKKKWEGKMYNEIKKIGRWSTKRNTPDWLHTLWVMIFSRSCTDAYAWWDKNNADDNHWDFLHFYFPYDWKRSKFLLMDIYISYSIVFLTEKDLKKKDEFTTDVYIMTNYVYDSGVNRRWRLWSHAYHSQPGREKWWSNMIYVYRPKKKRRKKK